MCGKTQKNQEFLFNAMELRTIEADDFGGVSPRSIIELIMGATIERPID